MPSKAYIPCLVLLQLWLSWSNWTKTRATPTWTLLHAWWGDEFIRDLSRIVTIQIHIDSLLSKIRLYKWFQNARIIILINYDFWVINTYMHVSLFSWVVTPILLFYRVQNVFGNIRNFVVQGIWEYWPYKEVYIYIHHLQFSVYIFNNISFDSDKMIEACEWGNKSSAGGRRKEWFGR